MIKTVFHIPKMDCPSEEQMIRLKLSDQTYIRKLDFQIQSRNLTVYHDGNEADILFALKTLKFGAVIKESVTLDTFNELISNENEQKKLLWKVLLINALFFVLEFIFGLISGSMGLLADGLDMLADSLVYILALFAIGASMNKQKKTAKWAGIFQLSLAILGLFELISRIIKPNTETDGMTMIWLSFLALLGNLSCLYLLQKSQSKEAHMRASMIFTSNDIMINLGVIIAGILVFYTQSNYPDIVIGSIVFLLVSKGSIDIIKLGR